MLLPIAKLGIDVLMCVLPLIHRVILLQFHIKPHTHKDNIDGFNSLAKGMRFTPYLTGKLSTNNVGSTLRI